MNVDSIIEKLLSVRGNKPGKQVDLKEEEIKFLIDKSYQIIKEQKMLVELEAPLHVCGDIHGQYYDLLRIFEHCGYPGEYNYLFLGDYVDRGKQSLETICLLLCYKIKYPEKVTLLRGNHESSVTNRIYGFYDECKRRYNVKLWKSFTDLFNFLPVAAIIDDKILCMHGGLSPDLKSIQNIQNISRPTDIPDTGLLCDLLWSDPDKDVVDYDENDRGVSVIFGEKVVMDFNKKNDLDLIIRAHQVVDDGYEFFANRQLITIFSAPNYCGEFDNSAGIMIIDDSLTCSLKVLRSSKEKIGEIILVGKNVCHSLKNTSDGIWNFEEYNYLFSKHRIKKRKCLHDLLMCHEGLSLLNLIDEELFCEFESVYPYNEGLNGEETKWGSKRRKDGTPYRKVLSAIKYK